MNTGHGLYHDNHRTVRNVIGLTVLFMLSLWGFFAYWAMTSRQELIATTERSLSQMAHAVEQHTTNLFKTAEFFQVAVEHWLVANPLRDPRTDAEFVALIEEFRRRTDSLIDIRMAKSNGDLYYFPNRPSRPQDNVSDREYFKAAINDSPGLTHIGIPVVSRVTGEWRLPVTLRMMQAHHGLEVINASINLKGLIAAFDSERPKPDGTIGIWAIDGKLLVRSPQAESMVGKVAVKNWDEWERIRTRSNGSFLSESTPIDSEARVVGHARLHDFPLFIVVTAALSDTLSPWYRQVLGVLIVLVMVTIGASVFATRLVGTLRILARNSKELERLAITDSLTGLYNHRKFTEAGVLEATRSQRYQRPMSLLMLDLDHFKSINDAWGHPAGDRVLQALSEIMNSIVRDQDTVGRLGGEEFGVILPETELSDACIIADRIRVAVEESKSVSADDGSPVNVTVSIGIASSSPGDVSFDSLLSCADKKLYEAKENGRNRVVPGDNGVFENPLLESAKAGSAAF